jgi:hypothetical protein
LNTFHSTLRESTQRLAGLFEKRFSAGLTVHADEPVVVAGAQTPGLHLGSEVLNNNFKEVDEFKQMTAGVATVFVRSRTAPVPSAPCSIMPTRRTLA